jgi:hypothetical protein
LWLKGISCRLFSSAVLLCLLRSPAAGTGLYLDLPAWFQDADTSGTELTAGETWLESDRADAIVLALGVSFNPGRRTSVKLGIIYPAIQLKGGFEHGFGDGSVSAATRIKGDSLNTSGLFLRWDARIPSGSGALEPFSFRSGGGIYPDVGAGFEFRKETSFLKFRAAATWTRVGQRNEGEGLVNVDYLLVGALVGIKAGVRTGLQGSAFSIHFDGAGHRECFLLGLTRELSGGLDLTMTGGIESGRREDRIFDSSISVFFTCRFPAAAAAAEGG